MSTKSLLIHALSPLHAGTGQGVGVIDLPITREKATALPYLPGSSIKGVMRDLFANEPSQSALFGPGTDDGNDFASAISVGDGKLLLLPVRSLLGTFAWVTSPYVLARFARDVSQSNEDVPQAPDIAQLNHALITATSALAEADTVYLEDLDLQAQPNNSVTSWATWLSHKLFSSGEWESVFQRRLCIVHDDILSFLLTTATEVVARIRLDDEKKTVTKGGLWYEESLPAETVLYSIVMTSATRDETTHMSDVNVMNTLTQKVVSMPMQFGGHASIGRGLCKVRVI